MENDISLLNIGDLVCVNRFKVCRIKDQMRASGRQCKLENVKKSSVLRDFSKLLEKQEPEGRFPLIYFYLCCAFC